MVSSLRTHWKQVSRTATAGFALSALLGLALPSGSSGVARPAESVGHVVLVTVDTLRADRLDCYGYSAVKTPNFSRLAKDGIRFKNAVTPVPLTLPSHSSIFTGTYPVHHGVRDQAGFPLSPDLETLASRMKALDMATGAFVGAFVLDSRFGLDRGFDYYYDRFDSTRVKSGTPELLERRAEAVASEGIRWMGAQRARRFFAWLHFYDPHVPYAAPEPFRSRHAGNPYDGEVAYTDSVLGRVLDFLVEKGWYNDSLVIVTSDHGEDLGEHGEDTHGYFVYESTVHVPLMIKLPRGKHSGTVIETQVSTVDILPTVLEVLGAPPLRQAQGRGLLSLVTDPSRRTPSDAFGETLYPYYHFGWNPLVYIRTGRFKYVDAPKPELYDLQSDPSERRNLAPRDPATASQLRDRLRRDYARLARSSGGRSGNADSATLEKLKSLGYLAHSSQASRLGMRQGLPDPKDKLATYNLAQAAILEAQRGNAVAATGKLEALLAREPGLTDARIHLGLLYKRAGKYEKAIEQFRLALGADDSNVIATYNLAHSYAAWGKIPEAIVGFKRTLELDPKEGRARVGLGIAYQLQGRLEEARKEYELALAIDPHDSAALKNLGGLFLSQGDPASAMEPLRKSLEQNRGDAETHNLLGSAHWLGSFPAAAEAEFLEAIRLDPKLVDAYLNLGMLLEKLNRAAEAVGYLQSAATLSPNSARVFESLGRAYLSAGMKAEAETALAQARKLKSIR